MDRAFEISEYIIKRYFKDGSCLISLLELQCILYLIQRECIGRLNKPAFYDEIVAWAVGPIVEDVFFKYDIHMTLLTSTKHKIVIDKSIKDIIDEVILKKMYASMDNLIDETRADGGAWARTYAKDDSNNGVISHRLIKQEYVTRKEVNND